MEEMKNLVPVVFANQRVLTYRQVAEGLNCPVVNLKMLFSGHKNEFQENVHFFNVEGEMLRQLKKVVKNLYLDGTPLESAFALAFGRGAKMLKLWTCQGVARLSKLVDTPEAWKLFTALENNYFNPPAPPAVVEQPPEKKKRKPPSDMAHAYGFLMSNATVKVGHAGEIDERIKRVESKHNLNVLAERHTPKVAREVARKIEKRVHRKFVACRVNGEFFQAPFDDVKDALDKCYAEEFIEISTPEGVIPYEDRQLLVELCKINSPFQHELIKRTANILLGDNIF